MEPEVLSHNKIDELDDFHLAGLEDFSYSHNKPLKTIEDFEIYLSERKFEPENHTGYLTKM
jgi:hypothetical protein